MRKIMATVMVFYVFALAVRADVDPASPFLKVSDLSIHSSYPLKRNVVTTNFWVGQGSSGYNDTTNYASAWDDTWTRSFGGVDHPEKRLGASSVGTVSLPKKFAPTRNPFYAALPFNDVKYPQLAAKYVPWWNDKAHRRDPYVSQCRGHWIMIEFNGKVCFAQWEDVGPFRADHAAYVFGDEKPTTYTKAGLDVSPAVRDYLGLCGMDKTTWRFVDNDEVPYGPWIEYGEQAILYSAIKAAPQKAN